MGAPKQKWTAEEEAALRAGVLKHKTGRWRTILSDPEFSAILHSRSNVDLKDKWRNINVTAIWGSRQKAKLALKRNQLTIKKDDSSLVPIAIHQPEEEEEVDPKPLAISGGRSRSHGSKEPIARLDDLIYEAIVNLKEPSGSDKASISLYIKDQYCAPPNFNKLLTAKLKFLTENGTLLKVKCKYRLAMPSLTKPEVRPKSPVLLLKGNPMDSSKAQKKEINSTLTKSQVDSELAKIRDMTIQEAAAVAAQAVAEAEFAIAEAERAAREAEAAEAKAEAAQIFAKAAKQALRCRAIRAW